jgi:hypothetical protein
MGQPIREEDWNNLFTPKLKQETLKQISDCYNDYNELEKQKSKYEFREEDWNNFFTPKLKQETLKQLSDCYNDYNELEKQKSKYEFIAISIALVSIWVWYSLF